jgi:hypothetical protein
MIEGKSEQDMTDVMAERGELKGRMSDQSAVEPDRSLEQRATLRQ